MSSDHQPSSARSNEQVQPDAHVDAAETSDGSARRRTGLGGSLWFAFKAIEIRLRFIAILVGIGLVIGYWDTIKNHWDKWTRPSSGSVALSTDSEFYCPMHPSVVRDKLDPGGAIPKCPICGMPLSKRKKGELAQLPEGVISRVQLSPYRIELGGIKTLEAIQRPLTINLRTVGYVAIDERKQSRIVVRVAGYVEKLYVNESFAEVNAGDPLVQIYSPELHSAVQELLIARKGTTSHLSEIATDKLRLLGVADKEIDEIVRDGKAGLRLILRAPRSGYVFEKRIVDGDHVEAGQMLFDVADLSTVWIEGEVYEKDAAMVRRGQAVEASIDAFPGQAFNGHVGLVHPHVETSTRTVRVRFELENPNHMLRPGMFATVTLRSPVLETEPFHSQLAASSRDLVLASAVASGSDTGDKQASSGNALRPLDDDSLAATQKVCPVTGAKLGSMGKPIRAVAEGHTVLLCCAGCVDKLAARPAYYMNRLSTVSEDGVLAVPEQAIIDTGNAKIVYVEREPGLFEGVAVTLGRLSEGYYPVIDGLLPGDRIAAAGAFLVDAETRLNPAAASAYFGASGAPPSGAGSSAPSATRANAPTASSDGQTEKNRANVAKLPESDRKLAEQQGTCPITDMPLGSMGVPYKMTVQGTPVFLCCAGCEGDVKKNPQAALAKISNKNPSGK